MFLSEDRFEIMRVDIPLSSKSVRFGAKMTRIELDDKVELGEVLRPLHLSLGQDLGSRKILKVFMICNNVDRIGQIFQVVSPNLKGFKSKMASNSLSCIL